LKEDLAEEEAKEECDSMKGNIKNMIMN